MWLKSISLNHDAKDISKLAFHVLYYIYLKNAWYSNATLLIASVVNPVFIFIIIRIIGK